MAYTDFALTIYRGDDRRVALAVLQPDGVTAQDITGWTLWFTAKRSIADPDNQATFQRKTGAGLGVTITDATGGLAEVALVPANTDGLTADSTALYCDVQGKDATGKVVTLATGKITVLAEITRATS